MLITIGMLSLSSCFTGIESTPRIEASKDVEVSLQPTEEQKFVECVKPEAPSQWQPGKQWLVADDKISLIFSPSAENNSSLKGEVITYESRRNIPSITGEDVVELTFVDSKGRKFVYDSGVNVDDFSVRNELVIPFAIEMLPVELADSLMRGNTYYIKSPRWYDAKGNVSHGLRHIAVTIDSVVPGNAIHPLMVAFHQENDSQQHYVMMTYGAAANATRNFDVLFSFADPRASYQEIEEETWQLITRSEVKEGMTRDECRLALGAPNSLLRGAAYGEHVERWTYDNGVFLIFEDGILTRFRK